MSITVLVPGALRDEVRGQRSLDVEVDAGATLAELLDTLATSYPGLERRIRDEAGQLRRFVNVFVGEDEVRTVDGLSTALPEGVVVHVLPSVAGG